MDFSVEKDALLSLAELGFRATYHRLRGVRGVVAGWIEIGIPDEQKTRILANLAEEQDLLLRLEEMHKASIHPFSTPDALVGNKPDIFLAASLKLGTPEEGAELMPSILKPQAGLALAVWLLQRQSFEANVHPLLSVIDGDVVATIEGCEVESAPPWPHELAEFVKSETHTKLVFAEDTFSFPSSDGI
ncbi:MAG: hypothetical protein QGF46_01585 [Planctomycetota bacterium]|jgi:hypothetical protein|nr:hypothetical protein [Planctomycetota bacterium]